jgi:hypothetical protein
MTMQGLRRLLRVSALAAVTAVAVPAQMKMNVAQLKGFIESSIRLRHDDFKVAAYLKRVQLTERLSDRTVEEMIGLGAGARTINALRDLRDATQNLAPALVPSAEAKPLPPPIPSPSDDEQKQVLDKVTEYSLEYDKRLPDFICAQVTRRYFDPTGLEFWSGSDTITARLTYFQNKEEKKVILVNNRYQDIDYDRLGGATSTGEFGSLLKEVFDPGSHASFQWERWATLRGKRMYVFSYRVARPYSKWKLVFERSAEDVPGYRGLVFVEKETLQVMRVTLEADDITPSFPINAASTRLDYDYADISGRSYLLPLRAEVRMRAGKQLSKNEVEFRLYRKFGAEAEIKFADLDEPLDAEKFEEKPAAAAKP